MSDASLPKAPDSEKGKQVREQYFALAKSSARGVKSYKCSGLQTVSLMLANGSFFSSD
jgi:hypothetical protein